MAIKTSGKTTVAKWVWQAYGIPQPIEEYRFCKSRKFRFDYCWVVEKVALEIEGGTWKRGRHVRGRGYERDCEKYSIAAVHGWKVIRGTPAQLKSGAVFELLKQALGIDA